MSAYRVSSRGAHGALSPIPWWKKPFRWFVAWLQVRREAALIEALRDKEREYYMLGGLVLVREMREVRDAWDRDSPPPLPVPGPGRERLG